MNTDKDEFFGCMGRAFLSIQGPLWPLTDTAVEPHRTWLKTRLSAKAMDKDTSNRTGHG